MAPGTSGSSRSTLGSTPVPVYPPDTRAVAGHLQGSLGRQPKDPGHARAGCAQRRFAG
jgi:hypothetical protein